MLCCLHFNSDTNNDGLTDAIDITIKSYLSYTGEDFPVTSVKFLTTFSYKLRRLVHMDMQGLAFVHFASAAPGSSLDVDGELQLKLTVLVFSYSLPGCNPAYHFAVSRAAWLTPLLLRIFAGPLAI